MKTIALIFALFLVGCQTDRIRSEDLNSWQGRSVIDLEKQHMFSAMSRDRRDLPNGESIINYTDTHFVAEAPLGCDMGNSYGDRYMRHHNYNAASNDLCRRTEIKDESCVHQFLIRNDKVVSYKVIGSSCYTSCNNRPDNSPCEKK